MAGTDSKKLDSAGAEREMKKVAGTTPGEPIVLTIPRVVEPVTVELALRTVPVDHEHVQLAVRVAPCAHDAACFCHPVLRTPPPIEYSPGCIVFGIIMP